MCWTVYGAGRRAEAVHHQPRYKVEEIVFWIHVVQRPWDLLPPTKLELTEATERSLLVL